MQSAPAGLRDAGCLGARHIEFAGITTTPVYKRQYVNAEHVGNIIGYVRAISNEEYEAIKEKEKATRDKRVSERLKVLMLIYEGYKVSEITRITGRNKSGIYRLYNRYRE